LKILKIWSKKNKTLKVWLVCYQISPSFELSPFPIATHLCQVTVHLSMKEGSLFCFVVMRSTEPGCFRSCSWCLWKALDERGAWAWFHDDVWTCGAKVLEYWMFSSLKIKLNRSWNFGRNWNVPLVLLERSWWAGFMGFYLVRFGFRMWVDFWVIFASENSNKFQKTRFWKLRTWYHLGHRHRPH
jgi:hypothetical protein